MAKAYFDCVNDNGGINGRPVQYITETEQTNPQQVVSLVTKMWEDDEGPRLRGQHEPARLPGQPAVLRGARHLRDRRRRAARVLRAAERRAGEHGAQLLVARRRAGLVRQGAKSLVGDDRQGSRARITTTRVCSKLAKKLGIPGKSFLEPSPITDGAAVALKLVEAAGDGGGVVFGRSGRPRC